MRSRRLSIIAAFATIYFVWGSTYLAIGAAVQDFPPVLLGGVRFTLAGSLLYAAVRLRGAPRPAAKHWRGAALLGALFFLAANGAINWTEAHGLPTSAAALLVATVPLWVLLFDRLLNPGRRLALRQLVGIGLGFGGIALLVGGSEATGVEPWMGGLVLFGAACWGLGSNLAPRLPRPKNGALSAAMQMLAGGLAALVVSQVIGERPPPVDSIGPKALAAFGYLVVIGSILAFRCYLFLLDNVPATRVSTYAFINPVVAAVLGLTVGEPFGWRSAGAMALVVLAVAITLSSSRGAPRRQDHRCSQPR